MKNQTSTKEKFNFSKEEVVNAANKVAFMISQEDNCEAKVHDFEFYEGRGAGFEISLDGEEFAGGSYIVKANGEIVNMAIPELKVYGVVR